MPFLPRLRVQIRQSYLGNLAARFTAIGARLLTAVRSFDYLLGDALAVEIEGLEAQAGATTQEIFPDTASDAGVVHHGQIIGLAQQPASPATLPFSITGGPASTTVSVAGFALSDPTGLVYLAAGTVTFDSGGNSTAPFSATCQTPGSAGNLPTVCTWSSAPVGLPPTATVASVSLPGTDAETSADFARRILQWWAERPASGNRADVVAWCTAVQRIESAFVWPLMSPAGAPGVLGCWYVTPMGPVATDAHGVQNGDNVTNSRVIDSDLANIVKGYIEGTNDATGNPTPNGIQLRPTTMMAGDYTIAAPATQTVDVAATVTVDLAHAYSWAGSATVDASSDATHLVLVGDWSGAGANPSLQNLPTLIFVGTNYIRGGVQLVTPPTVGVYNSGTGKTTFTFPVGAMLNTPSGGIGGSPTNWQALRLAVFALFDSLGPGDSVSPSLRWPPVTTNAGPTVYNAALTAALMGVSGVINVFVSGGDTTPPALTLATLGVLQMHG